MDDETANPAEELVAASKAAQASGSPPDLQLAVDGLLRFLRSTSPKESSESWSRVGVETVYALLERGKLAGRETDREAAANLTEALWLLPTSSPIDLSWPTIRTLIAVEDRSTPNGLARWANAQLGELDLIVDGQRRDERLQQLQWLPRSVRVHVVSGKAVPIHPSLWIRFLHGQLDVIGAADGERRLIWLDLAFAHESLSVDRTDDHHRRSRDAVERAISDSSALPQHTPAYIFWFLAASTAMRLAVEKHPDDLPLVSRTEQQFREASRTMADDVWARTVDSSIDGLSSISPSQPHFLAYSLQQLEHLYAETLSTEQRGRVRRLWLAQLTMRLQGGDGTEPERRRLRDLAAATLVAGDNDLLAVGALMRASEEEHDPGILRSSAALVRPVAERSSAWQAQLALGRILVRLAHVTNDPDVATETLAVVDRMVMPDGDPALPARASVRKSAHLVLAMNGDRDSARNIEVGDADDVMATVLRLDRELAGSAVTGEVIGRRLGEIVSQTGARDGPLPTDELILELVLVTERLAQSGVLDAIRADHLSETAPLVAAAAQRLPDRAAAALTSFASSRARIAGSQEHPMLLDLAISIGGEAVPDSRALGRLLLERYDLTHDDEDLAQARRMLLDAGGPPSVLEDRMAALGVIDRLLARGRVPRENVPDVLNRRLILLQEVVYDESAGLEVRLGMLRRMLEASPRMWPYLGSLVKSVTGSLSAQVLGGSATHARILSSAQGVSAAGAYAIAMSGDLVGAVEQAEVGQGLLAASALLRARGSVSTAQLRAPEAHRRWREVADELRAELRAQGVREGSSFPVDLASVEHGIPTEPPTRRLNRAEYFRQLNERSPEVAATLTRLQEAETRFTLESGGFGAGPDFASIIGHVQATKARLCYLVASPWGGLAVMVLPSGAMKALPLPSLTDARCDGWLDKISSDERWSPGPTTVRGHGPEPSVAATEQVLFEMSEVLREVAAELGREAELPVQLVPVGRLSALPLIAAVQLARGDEPWLSISVAASARLHIAAAANAVATHANAGILAITDASPSRTRDGFDLERLPAAQREGDFLAQRFDAVHVTGPEATVASALSGFAGHRNVLHLAVHGDSDLGSGGEACIYLVGDDGEPRALDVSELVDTAVTSRMVYLGACWTGLPADALPDEAVGFPTVLLQTGAAGVIAPLWPVEDRAAFTFATSFYESWVDSGRTAGEALVAAMRRTRDLHPETPTWAAFTLNGI